MPHSVVKIVNPPKENRAEATSARIVMVKQPGDTVANEEGRLEARGRFLVFVAGACSRFSHLDGHRFHSTADVIVALGGACPDGADLHPTTQDEQDEPERLPPRRDDVDGKITFTGRWRARIAFGLLTLAVTYIGWWVIKTMAKAWLRFQAGGIGIADAMLLVVVIGIPAVIWLWTILHNFFGGRTALARQHGARLVTDTMVAAGVCIPLEADFQREVGKLADLAGLPRRPRTFIYAGDEPNAFAYGHRRNYVVAASTALLKRLNADEIRAVLGHEIGHVANGDCAALTLAHAIIDGVNKFVRTPMVLIHQFLFAIPFVAAGVLLLLGLALMSGAYGMAIIPIGLIMLPVLGSAAVLLAQVVVCWLSRTREYYADAAGAMLVDNKQHMIAALTKLTIPALEVANPFAVPIETQRTVTPQVRYVGLFSGLFSTHPPIEKRIRALEKATYLPRYEKFRDMW